MSDNEFIEPPDESSSASQAVNGETEIRPPDGEDFKKYYKVLELDETALLPEIKSAYFHLRKLYSSDAMVISPILDDLNEERRAAILVQLDEAYHALKSHLAQHERRQLSTARERVARHNVPEFEVFTGNALKITREVLGIDLKEIALYSGISVKHLQNIEMERIQQLPPRGYIRVFLKKYAEFLSLDPDKVICDYMKLVDKKSKS